MPESRRVRDRKRGIEDEIKNRPNNNNKKNRNKQQSFAIKKELKVEDV